MSTALLMQMAVFWVLAIFATHFAIILPKTVCQHMKAPLQVLLFGGAALIMPTMAWVPLSLAGWFATNTAGVLTLTILLAFSLLSAAPVPILISAFLAWGSSWALHRWVPAYRFFWFIQGLFVASVTAWLLPETPIIQIAMGALSIPLFGFLLTWIFHRQNCQQETLQSEQKFATLMESSADGFILLERMRIVDCNPSMCQLLECSREEAIGKEIPAFSPEQQGDQTQSTLAINKYVAEVAEHGSCRFEWFLRSEASEESDIRVCEFSLFRMNIDNKTLIGGTVRDISGSRSETHFLALAHAVFDSSHEALIITDLHANIQYANPAFLLMTGYTMEEVMGQNPRFLKSNHQEEDFYAEMWSSLLRYGFWDGAIWNRRKDGEIIPCHLHLSVKRNTQNITTHYLGTLTNLAELARSKEVLGQVSLFDPLTRLQSRNGFLTKLTSIITACDFTTSSLAVVAIDLANFKTINSAYGHLGGDVLLKEFADRLQAIQDTKLEFARLGGDEFLACLQQKGTEIQLGPFFEHLSSIVKHPIVVHEDAIYISMILGVVLAEANATAESLIKQADAALHQAKESHVPYVVFDSKMQRQAIHDLALSKKLKLAIENNLLEVFYQPKVDVRTGKIRGMEALARWRDEQGKFIPPIVFIPLAEKNGLINGLFHLIVSKTIKDMAKEFLPIQRDLMCSINLSAHQFEIENLVQEITCRVDHEKIPRENIEFEVTESVFINNMEATRKTLQEFKDEGFLLSLDDFGTGFSSLTYLNNLPFDTLKIDKSFMDPVPLQSRSNAMTQSIVNLAHAINLRCVAEGVENSNQLEFLKMLGCDYWQGYLFSPPVEMSIFSALLKKNLIDTQNSSQHL